MRPTLTSTGRERRGAPRYTLALPVELKTASGVTRNVSATGVLFEATPGELPSEGRDVGFRLSLRTVPGHLRCRGRVVRVERSGARCVVASTIDEWQIECRPGAGTVEVTAAIGV